MGEPWKLTATRALALMRSGELTVEDYAKSLLSRIAARDSIVKAWAHLDADAVLAQARALDSIPAEKRGPLHGIAVGVKDVILTKDMPTKFNSPIYTSNNSNTSTVDAAPIISLRASGALIFGKTTTTEFACTVEGGPSTNPHDSSRTPGGSSSGSGAAVGDFQVPIALGTQTGGSTIRPGSFNGVYALKPTWGAISREGLAQYSITCDTLGLYARSAEDLQLLAEVFRLADDAPVPASPFELAGAKVAFCKTPIWGEAGPGLRKAWEAAKGLVGAAGAEVEEIELPEEYAKVMGWAGTILAGEGRSSFLGQYLLDKENLSKYIQEIVENGSKASKKDLLDAYDNVAKFRPIWDEIASRYDAVLTPSVPDEAPVGISRTGSPVFCASWTVLHVPCLNIPGFAGENGLPIGLTLVAPRYTDVDVLRIGKAIGEVFEAKGGWQHKLF